MRATLNIDDDLYSRAKALTGLDERAAVVHEALKALVERQSARQLAALGGSQPHLKPVHRRRVTA